MTAIAIRETQSSHMWFCTKGEYVLASVCLCKCLKTFLWWYSIFNISTLMVSVACCIFKGEYAVIKLLNDVVRDMSGCAWLNTILCLHNKVFLWSYEITYHVSNMIIAVDTSYSRRVAGHLQLLWDTILVSLVILTTSQKVILPWLIFLAPGRRSFNSSLVSWKWIQLSCLANLIMYIICHTHLRVTR